MSAPLLEYSSVTEVRGPLLVVQGVAGVGWDEFARIRLPGGEIRHGLVLEVDRDLAVVQVLEGTEGIDPDAVRVAFDGAPLRIPVGPGWLGRVGNGRGEPLDGGPPVLGRVTAPVTGFPLNPLRREPPPEPVLTGVSAIDGLTTLVRGQKLPVFSVAGLPHLELAAQIAAQATAGGEPFCVVVGGDGPHPRRRRAHARRAGGAVGGGGVGAAAQHRRRPGRRADPHPAVGADDRGASRLLDGTARARGGRGHDELLRGAAGGLRGPGRGARPSRARWGACPGGS